MSHNRPKLTTFLSVVLLLSNGNFLWANGLTELPDGTLRPCTKQKDKIGAIYGSDVAFSIESLPMRIYEALQEHPWAACVLYALSGSIDPSSSSTAMQVIRALRQTERSTGTGRFFTLVPGGSTNEIVKLFNGKFFSRVLRGLSQSFMDAPQSWSADLLLFYLSCIGSDPRITDFCSQNRACLNFFTRARCAPIFDQTLCPADETAGIVFCANDTDVYCTDLEEEQDAATGRKLCLWHMFSDLDLSQGSLEMFIVFSMRYRTRGTVENHTVLALVKSSGLKEPQGDKQSLSITIYDPGLGEDRPGLSKVSVANCFLEYLLGFLRKLKFCATSPDQRESWQILGPRAKAFRISSFYKTCIPKEEHTSALMFQPERSLPELRTPKRRAEAT